MIDDSYDRIAELEIKPKPHSMRRIYLLAEAVDITEAEDAVRRRLRNLERVISSIKPAPPLMDLGALYRLGDTT